MSALPSWDLSDLFPSLDSKEVSQSLDDAQKLAKTFEQKYDGSVAGLSGDDLAKAIAEYEKIEDILGRLASYAQLIYAADMTNSEIAQFYQNISEKVTDISAETLFFALAINKISDDDLAAKIKSSEALTHYSPWLRDVRAYKPYQLDDNLEELLHDKSVTGRAAWSRLFDETIAGMSFELGNEQLSSAEIFDKLSEKNEQVRAEAAKSIGKEFTNNSHIFTLVTNNLAKDKAIEDKWRGFAQPISSRNIANQVEDEVVDTLLKTVAKNYANLSHRYYKLKAGWLGKDKLNYWDRNAPLPDDDDTKYSWDEAVSVVLESYAAFSPEMAKIGKKFFDNDWIDADLRDGKSPGAFAHPTVPSSHPYLLVNFQGKTNDVMTLAHELGHGVHQVLSASQGALMADTPLTLAETASVFGEQLVFQNILANEKDKKRRNILIAGKIEDMLNTVVRQIAFCEFERQVHAKRASGELTAEDIGKIWLDVQADSLGDVFDFSPEYAVYWSYIPHFVHSPFYVYAYAFGDCLVNALYGEYQKQAADFEQKYIEMLTAGGTLRHTELLAPFGIDISKPDFWQQGLDIISSYIDELEE